MLRVSLGILIGFLSALLIAAAMALLLADVGSREPPATGLLLVVWFGGWVLSSFVVLRGANRVLQVLARGFLLGAAEWLAMVPVGFVFGAKIAPKALPEGGVNGFWAALQTAGFVSVITGGVAVAMTVVFLLAYTVVTLIAREMKK